MASVLPRPKLSSHPVDVGTRSEAAILLALLQRGYDVSVPQGVNHRYDLILDVDGELLRAQCKTGRLRNGAVIFSTKSVRTNTRGSFVKSYEGEIEIFLVYCPETRKVYCVPIDQTASGYTALRVTPPANNQLAGVRWAHDYELPE